MSNDGSRYLTIPEVAEIARCHHNTVRRAIKKRKLAATSPAGRLLIREQDAHAWIEAPQLPANSRKRSVRHGGTVAGLQPGW